MAERRTETAPERTVDLTKLNADAAAEALKAGRQSNGTTREKLADAKPSSS